MFGNKSFAYITSFLLIALVVVVLAITVSITSAAPDVKIIPGAITSKTKPVPTVTTQIPKNPTATIGVTTAITKTSVVATTPALTLAPTATPTTGTLTTPVTVTTPAVPTKTILPTVTVSITPALTTTVSLTPVPTITVTVIPTPTTVSLTPVPTITGTTTPTPTPITPALSKIEPISASTEGSTNVNISGYGFTGASEVLFGETKALSFRVVNDRLIIAVSPQHPAGNVTVSVITPQGISALEKGFAYNGALSVQMLTPKFSYTGKLSGNWLTLSSYFTVTVTDNTGSKAGWHLNASITKLTAGSKSSGQIKHTIEGVEIAGINKDTPQYKLFYPVALSEKAGSIFSITPNTGTGQVTLRFKTQLRLPADVIVGNYNFTLNLTVEPGL